VAVVAQQILLPTHQHGGAMTSIMTKLLQALKVGVFLILVFLVPSLQPFEGFSFLFSLVPFLNQHHLVVEKIIPV
jgi:hypothetical protein